MDDKHQWVWLDLEMTGLDPEQDLVLEIATVITDEKLEVVAEGPEIVVHQSDRVLAEMNEWCVRQHGESGLTDKVRASRYTVAEAEEETLRFCRQHAVAGEAILCGNSVWQDRRFLARYMPELAEFFHYRMIDVSTLKILMAVWAPELTGKLNKQERHRALDDVYDSIDELRLYRKKLLP